MLNIEITNKTKRYLGNSYNGIKIRKRLGNDLSQYPRVFFCSFPKCGRTWLRFILGNYLNIKYNLNLDNNFQNIYAIVPSLTNHSNILKAYHYLKTYDIPIILASNAEYNFFLFGKGKFIFMLRSIYDILVSYYFHQTRHRHKYTGDIKSFLRDNSHGVDKFVNYINSWAPQLNEKNSLVITYECLFNNTEDTFSNVVRYLNISFDEKIARDAITVSSFDNMKNIEVQNGIPDHDYNNNDLESRRVRRGKIGGYSEYLDEYDIRFVKDRLSALLSDSSKEIFEENRLDF